MDPTRIIRGLTKSGDDLRSHCVRIAANWHRLLTDGTGLPERPAEIHRLSEVELPLSELRIMDVFLWRYGKDQGLGVRSRRGRKA